MNPDAIKDGGPAFPCEWDYIGSNRSAANGMTLRDYFAVHSTQPGCSEICALKGLRHQLGAVWQDADTRIASFDYWWEDLPLDERLLLSARVRYAQADAMLKARKS